jgi:hypothetical protein
MKKVYKNPNRVARFLFVLPVAIIMLLFARMMLSAGINLEQLQDRLVAMGVGLLFLLIALWGLLDSSLHLVGAVKVITNDRSLTIQNVFSTHSINWEDITEFGTYKHWHIRVYYLKTKRYGDRKIQVCTEYLQELDELIETVFLKATYAKCLWIENIAVIPFTRRIEIVPWERKTRIGFLD